MNYFRRGAQIENGTRETPQVSREVRMNAVKTILIVDDDPEELATTCRTLGERFPVLGANSGEEALNTARSTHPSVIVLDVMMAGGKDGFTVFRELQKDAATRRIPVIFLSSVNQVMKLTFGAQEVGEYLGAEPFAFLEKPVSSAALLNSVEQALAREKRA